MNGSDDAEVVSPARGLTGAAVGTGADEAGCNEDTVAVEHEVAQAAAQQNAHTASPQRRRQQQQQQQQNVAERQQADMASHDGSLLPDGVGEPAGSRPALAGDVEDESAAVLRAATVIAADGQVTDADTGDAEEADVSFRCAPHASLCALADVQFFP